MGMKIVLTEKPSVGRDIAKVLKCNKKGKGCLIGNKYIITWALGHLVTLAQPEQYGDKYKSWRLEDLPMIPKKMELTIIKNTMKQYNNVKNLLKRKDVDELIIATDAGREGELVARWIIDKCHFKKPIKRLWISSQTERSIKEGFNNLKQGNEYINLYKSAQARAEADWLVGLNITRALTCKYNAQLSAGRVQTPTLAIIVQREEDIKNFKPKDYWTIEIKLRGFIAQWKDKNSNNTRIFDKDKADKIINNIKGSKANVIDIKTINKKQLPPLAYDLTELQREASNKYGFSPKKTLSLMQNLYERHKLVTYPRTDSKYITDDIVPTLHERLKSISIGPYKAYASNIIRNKINVSKRFVDNNKVSDHHAIIPTEQFVDLNSLNNDEMKIYDLIIRRFIAVLSSPFEYEQTNIVIDIQGEKFISKGRRIKSYGWKGIYENDNEEQTLPDIKNNASLEIIDINLLNNKTKPPGRYTEATLLSAMENPEKFIENKALKKAISNSSGLGTPATRADIIEKLYNTFYIEKRGNEIIPTSKGSQLISLVPNDLKSPKLTAKWEQKLKEISDGKLNNTNFITEMKEYTNILVKDVIGSDYVYKHNNISRVKCPECDKYMLKVKGKNGEMYVCQDRECGYRKNISKTTNARCPQCHKKMKLKGEGDKKIFTCICGYTEKLSSFNQRKKEQKSKISKKEVNKFLKKQEEDEPINSSLADALSKWKKDK